MSACQVHGWALPTDSSGPYSVLLPAWEGEGLRKNPEASVLPAGPTEVARAAFDFCGLLPPFKKKKIVKMMFYDQCWYKDEYNPGWIKNENIFMGP